MRRLLESLPAVFAEAVVGPTADLLGLQPSVLRETKYGRPHQALADTEARHCLYQAAEPHVSAARRDRVTKYRRDQRARSYRRSRLIIIDEFAARSFYCHRVSLAFAPANRTI